MHLLLNLGGGGSLDRVHRNRSQYSCKRTDLVETCSRNRIINVSIVENICALLFALLVNHISVDGIIPLPPKLDHHCPLQILAAQQ